MEEVELTSFKLANWGYFLDRCRRHIPERSSLLREFDLVCKNYSTMKDARTGEELFRQATYRKCVQVRKLIARGMLSDPEETSIQLYIPEEALVNGEIRRSEEHTSELQSLMRISYAVFCLKKKKHTRLT